MSLLACRARASCRQALSLRLSRSYAASPKSDDSEAPKDATKKPPAKLPADEPIPLSSCPAGTVLTGLNYLKGQQPVLAMADADYPAWLWSLAKQKSYGDDSAGGEAEKRRLRKENRQRLRDKNKFGAR
ncbi:hypothetical protein ID866_7066 [Astraeus odoratus]|nr:hypothetical protein ID866_7066 [Astraeus odoratus]